MSLGQGDPTAGAELASYVEVWWRAVTDFVTLLQQVPEADWSTPTDLAGWDVRAVAAHVAHLESVLATGVEWQAEVGEAPHIVSPMGFYTEIGPAARRAASAATIIEEIRAATTDRHEQLLADPPTDPEARPDRIFGGVPWPWRQLLRNRPLDVWMHEQDVRRAVGRPGGLDTPPAQHTADYLVESFGFVLAKKAGADAGTVAVLEVAGSAPYAATVTDVGRGQRLDPVPAEPDVRLAMDRESFVVLAGGRRTAASGAVTMTGDEELGARIVAAMGTTP